MMRLRRHSPKPHLAGRWSPQATSSSPTGLFPVPCSLFPVPCSRDGEPVPYEPVPGTGTSFASPSPSVFIINFSFVEQSSKNLYLRQSGQLLLIKGGSAFCRPALDFSRKAGYNGRCKVGCAARLIRKQVRGLRQTVAVDGIFSGFTACRKAGQDHWSFLREGPPGSP